MSAVKRARWPTACLFAAALQAMIWCVAAQPAAAQSVPAADSAAVPLADALRRFAREGGYDVVFPEDLVEGKQAGPVRNARNSYEALTQMLAGTGLVPRFTRRDAFVVEPASASATADMALQPIEVLASAFDRDADEYRWYGDKLLDASLGTLRRSPELGLKTYSFTLFVWLSKDGEIVDLDGYGPVEHQEALTLAKTVLQGLVVGAIPPVNMPQPVGLRIVSQ